MSIDGRLFETASYAIDAIRGSEHPLSIANVNELIPPSARIEDAEMEDLLAQAIDAGAVTEWPGKLYWGITPERHATAEIEKLLVTDALTAEGIDGHLEPSFNGISPALREQLRQTALASLVASGTLFEHPEVGGNGPWYSQRPASAAPYVTALKKEFDKLAEELASAGVSPRQIADALLSPETAGKAPSEPAASEDE